MCNSITSLEDVKIKAGSLFRLLCHVCLVLSGAYLLDSNFPPALYAASDHSVRSNCTETHLICKTWLAELICYLYSHKKKHKIHYDGVEMHFVLRLCISHICPSKGFHKREWIREVALGVHEA